MLQVLGNCVRSSALFPQLDVDYGAFYGSISLAPSLAAAVHTDHTLLLI